MAPAGDPFNLKRTRRSKNQLYWFTLQLDVSWEWWSERQMMLEAPFGCSRWKIAHRSLINYQASEAAENGSIWNLMRRWLIVLVSNLSHIGFQEKRRAFRYSREINGSVLDSSGWKFTVQLMWTGNLLHHPPTTFHEAKDNSIEMSLAAIAREN